MTLWRGLEDKQNQVQIVFALGENLGSITDNLLAKLRSNLFPKLHLGTMEGIDNANSLTAATSFKTTTPGPNGTPLSVEAFVRLEGDRAGGRFRLTARSKHPKVAQALAQLIRNQLQ